MRWISRSSLAVFVLASARALCVEGGYASQTSVVRGGSIDLHISTAISSFTLSIYREGAQRLLMKRVTGLKGKERDCDEPAYRTGCGWPVSYTLEVPAAWPGGVYLGEFDAESSKTKTLLIHFVVREEAPGSASPILFICATNTYNAYNSSGGKSLYSSSSSDGLPAVSVSYDRPYRYEGDGKYHDYEHPIVEWAERAGYPLELATSVDLHREPDLLSHYDCVVFGGHDEYWTREMRDHVDAFLHAGGNILFLGGNTCWWQARFSDDLRTLHCYKATADESDPFAIDKDPSNDHLVTTNWYKPPVRYPENSTTGLGWRDGGFHNYNGDFTAEEGFGGYRVYRTSHWLFEGTDLEDGQSLGRQAAIVGYEVDGTPLEARDPAGRPAWDRDGYYPLPGALPFPTDTDASKTPESFVVLGVAPATRGHAVMGTFEAAGGGQAFNAGTVFWGRGLAVDPAVARITSNALHRFTKLDPPANARPWVELNEVRPDGGDASNSVFLRGSAFDLEEDGGIGAYRWRSSADGFLSNEATFSGPLSPGTHTLFFSAQDLQGAWSDEAVSVIEVPEGRSSSVVIIDDGGPGASSTGDWRPSSGPLPYGAGSRYSRREGSTYTFEAELPGVGRYKVYIRWTGMPGRRTDVPVEIRHEGGSNVAAVDQSRGSGEWRSLGTWRFGAGAAVKITSPGVGTTCADAVKLVRVEG